MSEVDMPGALTIKASSGRALAPKNEPDSSQALEKTLHGILSNFRGELSQLDTTSTPGLELRDPSIPPRNPPGRSNTDGNSTSGRKPNEKCQYSHDPKRYHSTPTVTVRLPHESEDKVLKTEDPSSSRNSPTLEAPTGGSTPSPSPSLSSPGMSASRRRSAVIPPPLGSPARNGGTVRPVHGHSSSRELVRLRTHRSTASSSEPSLVPTPDDTRLREQKVYFYFECVSQKKLTESPTLTVGSQQDLTTGVQDLSLSRYASHQSLPAEEPSDIESRGKELAARCWAEDEEFLAKEKIAEWLGGLYVTCVFILTRLELFSSWCRGRINKVALRHYMDSFDFSGLRLDVAFR